MIGAKPIEAGCRAITYNCRLPANNNIALTVLYFIGKVKGWEGDDRWETDTVIPGVFGGITKAMRECRLMRIDDPEIQEQIEDELEVVV